MISLTQFQHLTKWSLPGVVVLAAEELAGAKGLDKVEVLRANNSNIKRVYGVDP